MRNWLILSLALMLGFVPATTARAASVLLTDVFNPLDVLLDGQSGIACAGTNGLTDFTSASTCKSLSWTQTLPAYNKTDILSDATLTLTVYNDATTNNQKFTLLVGLLPFSGSVTDASTPALPNMFGFSVLSELSDGVLNLRLTAQNGNHSFYFAQSQLQAVASVPDSGTTGTMLLVSIGILAWTDRRLRRSPQ